MTKVLMLITHDLLGLGVVSCLRDIASGATFHQQSCWEDLHTRLSESSYDLLILDSGVAELTNVATLERIRHKYPSLKTILLAYEERKAVTLSFLKIGIEGVCMTSTSQLDFLHAFSTVMQGKKFLDHKVTEYLLTDLAGNNSIRILTNRESQITNLLIQGLRTADIAKNLNLAVSTVSTIKFNIFKKMQVTNIVELANKIDFTRKNTQSAVQS